MLQEKLEVYFIMGSTNCLKSPQETLKSAIQGGITIFQFREKGPGSLEGEDKLRLAKELQAICQQSHIPFLVNDDIDLAVKINADGLHIGQDDENLKTVRERLPDKIIGISTHTMEEVKSAIAEGADYLGIGPVYATTTKKDTKTVQGTKLIKELREASISIPLVGIGGITEKNAEAVVRAGANGVSIITAISKSQTPSKAAELLKAAVKAGKRG